jgi:transposase
MFWGNYAYCLYEYGVYITYTHQASAKRVHDAKEVYDGVPSLHDAKAATIIGRFYKDGLTKPWREQTEKERNLNALQREYHMHESNFQVNQGRLEAYLSRHWPEVTFVMSQFNLGISS